MPKRPLGKLRIIGGEHRSRLIEFDGDSGVRPTPDRVRQTVFDWLTPVIEDARCLDLFSGSGAMGFEALSRGAGHVTFVETGVRQSTLIKTALMNLHIPHPRYDVSTIDALYFLTQTWHRYNVVFLDPPFGSGLLEKALEDLAKILAPQNRVCLEWPQGSKPILPEGFVWLREKQAGQVCFGLATTTAEPS
jgi:16S rRNA (guanine966-N2)-methyltransferase